MKIDNVIKILRENYKRAVNSDYVRKPIAWALYQTWREIDALEEKEKRKVVENNDGNGQRSGEDSWKECQNNSQVD